MRTFDLVASSAALLGLTSAVAASDLLHDGCVPGSSAHRDLARRSWLQKRQAGTTAGEGKAPASSGGASAASYQCDSSKCQLPNCHCASTDPPGGLDIKDVPQFILWTSDDAVQTYTTTVLDKVLGGRKNPNGCPVRSTYFASLSYTNYSMITNLYVAGHEIADHTMTHAQQYPTVPEISGNLVALNALAGIPYASLGGFRAPFLNYSRQTLEALHQMNFLYDSSASASLPVTDANTDAFWPYTLDYGMANDCKSVADICRGEPKLPGMWEIPMYAVFGPGGAADAHLMDPWLDVTDAKAGLDMLKNTFMDHYTHKKQPFGLYSHPIHLATDYPGIQASAVQPKLDLVNNFLNWATTNSSMPNVWVVTNKQLLAWMRNPVPASRLNELPEFQCKTPDVPQASICNGMPDKEKSVLQQCISNTAGDPLNNSPFYTCYGCPTTVPTPQQPNPPQKPVDGKTRTRINDKCDTPFWDPIAGKCLNSGFTDVTRAIGPNGANLTSTGDANLDGKSSSKGGSGSDGFKTFGGAAASSYGAPATHVAAVAALLSALVAWLA